MTDSLSRRNFLFFGGAAVTGVTLGQLARRQLAWADRQSRAVTGPGEERWAVSVCRECPAACGVHVRLIDGMPVKLEGNPLCPVARGRLCAKGQAGIEAYYDPDRVTGPARRVGPPGASAWERISWEEAIGMLVEQLGSVPTGPGELLAVAAEENGPTAGAWAGVWAAAGARLAWTSAATARHLRGRLASLTGVAAEPHFDFEHATYVLSLGAPLVEDWLSPVWAQRAYGRFRRSAWQARGRLVQIEGRRSLTARKADEWIAVPEDRHVALVYGLAGVLLRENRIDREALEPHAGNLAEFERAVTTRFTPDEVAAATGVPVVTILRLARELLSTVRPVVVVNADASRDLVDAVLALNAILGTFDRPGGIFSALPPVHEADRIEPQPGQGSDIEPRVVLLRDAAEFRSLTVTPGFERALTTAELVVSFSPFLDEAASVADLLLPTHTALESWQAVVPPTGLPSQTIALARPAAEPLLETRDLITILKGIADAVGGPMTVACPWESSAELVREELTRLDGLRRGSPYVTIYETEWVLQLERGGWWTPVASSPEEFADVVLDAGGWADPFFEPGQIRTRLLDRGGYSFVPPPVLPAAPLSVGPTGADYPLRLRSFMPVVVNSRGSPNQPVLFELLGQPEALPWGAWVEMSPETAHEAGVETGEHVHVESQTGAMEVSVVAVEGMPAGVVELAFVPSVPDGGRWARSILRDVRSLASDDALRSGWVAVRIPHA